MHKRVACVILLNLLSACFVEAQAGSAVRSSATEGVATSSTLYHGYKNVQGECELAGDAVTMYWDSVPCFYVHVVPSVAGAPITGSVLLKGTAPDGSEFAAGPYALYADADGGGHLYIVYNDGLGDAGEYSFTMSYGGDDNYQASQSAGTIVVPIRPLPTTVRIDGPTAIVTGNTAVISVNLASPVFPGVTLWGPIALYDGDSLLQETYAWSNSFLLAAPLKSAGTHTISARFGGLPGRYDVLNAAASSSNLLNVVAIDPNPLVERSIELNVTPNPPARGEVVTLTARIADHTQRARGTVTFFDGRTPLSTVPLISRVGGEESTATLKLALGVGKHVITARCDALTAVTSEGAQAYASATSAPTDITVSGPAETDSRLLVEANGSKYRVTATVFAWGPSPLAGVVDFRDLTSSVVLGSVALDSSQSSPAFTEPRVIPFSGQVGDLATADLNGDGFTDLVIVDGAENTVHVLMGKGGALFDPQQGYPVSAKPSTMTIADVDRDGTPEIVVGTNDRTIEISSLTRDGSLRATKILQTCVVPHRILAGDLNGDGMTDIVVFGQGETSNLSVYLGNASGSFDEPVSCAIPGLETVLSALLVDFNNDGIPDLLISDSNSGTYEMLGTGDGTLQAAAFVSATSGAPIAADLNGDGSMDLAFVPFEGMLAVQLGLGDGTFASPRYYYERSIASTVPSQSSDASQIILPIALADFNADGIPDLFTSGAIYLGVGDGTFSDGIAYQGKSSTVSDLNGDGVPDLLYARTNAMEVRFGGTAGTARLGSVSVRGNGSHEVEAEFVPLQGGPYAGSGSRSVQVEATMPAFTFAVFPSSLSIEQGSTAMATVAVASANGYSGTLRFSCEELTGGLNCVFRPSSLTLNETGPYNQTDLIVSAAERGRESRGRAVPRTKLMQVFAAILAGALGFVVSGTSNNRATRERGTRLTPGLLVTMLFLTLSCGGGPGTTSGRRGSTSATNSSYNVTIVVTDGAISRTTELTVAVR